MNGYIPKWGQFIYCKDGLLMETLNFEKLKEMKELLDNELTLKEKFLEWKGDLKPKKQNFYKNL